MDTFIRDCLVRMADAVMVVQGTLTAIISYSDGAASADSMKNASPPPFEPHQCELRTNDKDVEE